MQHLEVQAIKIKEIENEFPFQVEIVGKDSFVYGAGMTLNKALMRAFGMSGMFPNKDFPLYTEKELARFIFWAFNGGRNWKRAISSLENESN